MTTLRELRTTIRAALVELFERTESGTHELKMGAKATRLLGFIESEQEWGSHWRRAIEDRAAEIAVAEGRPELFSYHVVQAMLELFNEDEKFRRTMHAQVDSLSPRDRP